MKRTARAVANKIECFALDAIRGWVVAGTNTGLIEILKLPSFEPVAAHQVCAGGINALAVHPKSGAIACLGLDRTVTVLTCSPAGELLQQVQIDLRTIDASNDFVPPNLPSSDSQALAWHPMLNRLATRNAASAVLELVFQEDTWDVVHCTRLHEDQDLVSLTYVRDSTTLLSGSIRGEIVYSKEGEEIRRWQFGDRSIHWFEHLENGKYLVASDTRRVGKLDLEQMQVVEGPVITQDDLEHVTYISENNTAYVCGFDKNIYVIDVETCESTAQLCRLPFKARWMTSISWLPGHLLVQCYDGSLNLIDTKSGTPTARLHRTPPVLWTGTSVSREVTVYAGDGDELVWKRITGWDEVGRNPVFDTKTSILGVRVQGYVKRIAYVAHKNLLALACTEQQVLIVTQDGDTRSVRIPATLRDLTVDEINPYLYCAAEDGWVYRIDVDSGTIQQWWRSPSDPVWALALNRLTGQLVVAERRGGIFILATDGALMESRIGASSRPKRIKWLDDEKLIVNSGDALQLYCAKSKRWKTLLASTGNTIEDFCWDAGRRYLVSINYCCDIHLVDLSSGELLHIAADQIDYSKGLIFLDADPTDQSAYPYHFLTFGRSGQTHLYRIHNDKLYALGAT
jgi:WD40 repeat protein